MRKPRGLWPIGFKSCCQHALRANHKNLEEAARTWQMSTFCLLLKNTLHVILFRVNYVYCRPVGTGQQVGRNFEIISLHNILLKSFTSYLRTSQNIESTLAASNLSGSSAFVSAQDPALIEARFSKLFKVSCRKPLAIAICIKQ